MKPCAMYAVQSIKGLDKSRVQIYVSLNSAFVIRKRQRAPGEEPRAGTPCEGLWL